MKGELEKVKEWPDWVAYRTTCDCMDGENHGLSIILETDRDGMKSATFYYKTIIKGWWQERKDADNWKEWFQSIAEYIADTVTYRVKKALRVLFTGYIELEGDFIFRGDKQILAVAEALIKLVKSDKVDKKEEPPPDHKDPCDGCSAGPKSECPCTPDAC